MTIAAHKRTELVDVRELRAGTRFEVRADTDEVILTGYAATFQEYEMYGGPERGGWIEQIATTAFDKTLREKPDLHLLINHEGMPLARTKSGTLKLSVDKHGLRVEAKLDRADPDVQRLVPKMRRNDMDEMSFAFRVKSQSWCAAHGFEGDVMSHRTITEVSLHKGDVSVVNFGANPTTTAEVLGRRRRRGTARLSRAEAAAIVLADEKRRNRTGGKARLSRAEAAAIVLADEKHRPAHSDAIMERAEQLLRTLTHGEPAVARSAAEAAEAEHQRRAKFDADLARRRHRRDMRQLIGRDVYGDDRHIRELVEREQQRRAEADTTLQSLRRHESVADAMGGDSLARRRAEAYRRQQQRR